MFQRTCQKIFIDFLNHAISNDEHGRFRFWGVGWVLRWWWWFFSLSLSEDWLSLFITWLISFIIANVTSLLVKCVVSSGTCFKNTINLYIFCSAFFFANFVNWRLWSDWMGFGVMGIQVSQLSSFFFFQKFCHVSDFHMDCYFCIHQSCVWAVFWWHCFFLLIPPLKSQFHF